MQPAVEMSTKEEQERMINKNNNEIFVSHTRYLKPVG